MVGNSIIVRAGILCDRNGRWSVSLLVRAECTRAGDAIAAKSRTGPRSPRGAACAGGAHTSVRRLAANWSDGAFEGHNWNMADSPAYRTGYMSFTSALQHRRPGGAEHHSQHGHRRASRHRRMAGALA